METKDLLDAVEEHLDQETEILRHGRIKELASLLERREELIGQLDGYQGDARRLSFLRSKAERNAELLEACKGGVSKALARLGELQDASGPISSYSAVGNPTKIGTIRPEFEKKA